MTNSIFGVLDFYIVNRGVIFGDFFTIFAYKIVNIDVESTKIVTKMQTINRITKKILEDLANFDKKCHFLLTEM